MRRRVAGLAALSLTLAVGITGVVMANASHLPVTGGQLSAGSVDNPCATATLAVTNAVTPDTTDTDTVTVRRDAAWPAECESKQVQLVVAAGAVNAYATFAPPAVGTDVAITLDSAFTPTTSTTAQATVAGWAVGATFTFTPPSGPAITCSTSNPTRPCTATVVVRNGHVWSWGYDLDIVVRDARTVPANNPVTWTVEIDFRNALYPWVPNGIDGWSVLTPTTCADLPVLTLTGRPDHYNHTLTRGTEVSFSIQPHNNGTGNLLACG